MSLNCTYNYVQQNSKVKHAWAKIIERWVTYRKVIYGTIWVRTKQRKRSCGECMFSKQVFWAKKKKSKPTVKHGVAHMQLNEFSSLQMISEPNLDECGVKWALFIGGESLGTQQGCCTLWMENFWCILVHVKRFKRIELVFYVTKLSLFFITCSSRTYS